MAVQFTCRLVRSIGFAAPAITSRLLIHRFLASTHYTNYNPWLFAINVTALLFVLIPKLPQVRCLILLMKQSLTSLQFHRTRVRFMPTASGVSTPLTPNFSASGANTPVREHPPPAIHITEANFR